MEGNILDFLGTELIGVMSPVSICMLLVMLLVILLVSTLSPSPSHPSSPSQTLIVTAANLVYSENPFDSAVQKLEAIYDSVAILAPGGPLKILVELSRSRDDDLPALIYEARPTISRSNGGGHRSRAFEILVSGVSYNSSIELQNMSTNEEVNDTEYGRQRNDNGIGDQKKEKRSFNGGGGVGVREWWCWGVGMMK